MLESNKGSRKKNKLNYIKKKSQNSYNELNDKNIIVAKRKRKYKKKNKATKEIKRLQLDNIKLKEKEKTLFSLGEINIAKIHSKVTKPLI